MIHRSQFVTMDNTHRMVQSHYYPSVDCVFVLEGMLPHERHPTPHGRLFLAEVKICYVRT